MCLSSLWCVFPLSLLEGVANGIDDAATQFAEVEADLTDFGENWVGKWAKRIYCNQLCFMNLFFPCTVLDSTFLFFSLSFPLVLPAFP